MSSSHCYDVHAAWPIAHLNRIRRRCSDSSNASKLILDFLLLYKSFQGVSLEEVTPSMHRKHALKRSSSNRASWIVLPFSMEWLNSRFRNILRESLSHPLLGNCDVRVAWSLGNRHLIHVLRDKASTKNVLG